MGSTTSSAAAAAGGPQQQQQQQQPPPTAADGGTGAAAAAAAAAAGPAPAAAGAAAAAAPESRKRVLTESQLQNLCKKACTSCGEALPCASKKCRQCGAQQQLQSERERSALLQPLEPYCGRGDPPKAQNSTQALANVTKRFQKLSLVKEVSSTKAVAGSLSGTRAAHLYLRPQRVLP